MEKGWQSAQLRLWTGAFGQEYLRRNDATPERVRATVHLWARIMACLAGNPPRRILEVGSNLGINLRALRLLTDAELFALDPNHAALERLVADGVVPESHAIPGIAESIALPDSAVDMAFTCGVLIHVHPDRLLASLREIHRVAGRHVVCVEYYADKPEMVNYHGEENQLFKRDFGGLWLDSFPDLCVLDYGFSWMRMGAPDNLTWWVLQKGEARRVR